MSQTQHPSSYFKFEHAMFGVFSDQVQELVFIVEARDDDEAHVRADRVRAFLGIGMSHPLIVQRLAMQAKQVPIFMDGYFAANIYSPQPPASSLQ